mmetsp:Transcript_74078/g.199723  ORF Transcript_74078/g.199723 Transcript_74078/m.199723 type:complete len:302 (+) Transcript_74078:116-1021(+)
MRSAFAQPHLAEGSLNDCIILVMAVGVACRVHEMRAQTPQACRPTRRASSCRHRRTTRCDIASPRRGWLSLCSSAVRASADPRPPPRRRSTGAGLCKIYGGTGANPATFAKVAASLLRFSCHHACTSALFTNMVSCTIRGLRVIHTLSHVWTIGSGCLPRIAHALAFLITGILPASKASQTACVSSCLGVPGQSVMKVLCSMLRYSFDASLGSAPPIPNGGASQRRLSRNAQSFCASTKSVSNRRSSVLDGSPAKRQKIGRTSSTTHGAAVAATVGLPTPTSERPRGTQSGRRPPKARPGR